MAIPKGEIFASGPGGNIYLLSGGKIYGLDWNTPEFSGTTGSEKSEAAWAWVQSQYSGSIPIRNISDVISQLAQSQGKFGQEVMGGLLQKGGFFSENPSQVATSQSIGAGEGYEVGGAKYALAKDIVDPNAPPGQQTGGVVYPTATPTPTPTPAPISTESLGTQTTPIPVPASTPPTDNASVVVAGAEQTTKSVQDYINLLTPPPSEKSTQLDKLIADYTTGLSQTEGRGAAQLQAEQQLGVPEKKAALTAVNSQILTKTAEFNQIQAQLAALSTDVEGKPITMSSIIGSQSQIQNKLMAYKNSFAADIGLLQAQALGLQGQLTDAQNAANRAIDLRYADIDTKLANQRILIELLSGQLSKEEAIRADAVKLWLDDQEKALADQKQEDRDIQGIMINAANAGADQNTLAAISRATTVEQAVQIASGWYQTQQGKDTEKSAVLDLAGKYPDAGIALTDTLSQAQAKLQNSKLYQDQTSATAEEGAYKVGEIKVFEEGNEKVTREYTATGWVEVARAPRWEQETPTQPTTPSGEVVSKPYWRVDGTNEVYETSTGTWMTAEEFAKRGNPFDQVQVVKEAPTAESVAAASEWRNKKLTASEAIDYQVPLGTTWGQVSDKGIVPARYKPSTTNIYPTSDIGDKFNTRLDQEIDLLYGGRYGKEGSREQIITILKKEFPQMDVAGMVYTRVPDGYETKIKTTLTPEEQLYQDLNNAF